MNGISIKALIRPRRGASGRSSKEQRNMAGSRIGYGRRGRQRRLMAVWASMLVILAAQAAWTVPAVSAATNTIKFNVVSARTEPRTNVVKGDEITNFKFLINIDNTGTTEQKPAANGAYPTECTPSDSAYPENCNWASVAGLASNSPIYTQGDQGDVTNGINLPDGRYLISVLADGYQLDGAHFSVPSDSGIVTVELQPYPLPDGTIRAQVFEDLNMTNGAYDAGETPLAGFQGKINDYIGQVSTDVYGNPLCTRYEGEDPDTYEIPASALDADGAPIPIPGTGGGCYSDATGMLAIPHVGPNRYALSLTPPADYQDWIQTTTLEGNHDWDAWVMEGSTGYDTEFVVAGEPVPSIIFGYVPPSLNALRPGNGTISGVINGVKVYIPPTKGVTGEPGFLGGKMSGPVDRTWIALNDLDNGDIATYVAPVNPDGSFSIPNVAAGSYALTYWDEAQDYILDLKNVNVGAGENVDIGVVGMAGWWARLDGYVFDDTNRNGIKDPGEEGVANYTLTLRKRENSLMDRGSVLVTTDANGYYFFESAYPLTEWVVLEAYNDLYYTTGITYQADNQPEPTTVLGAGVDLNFLPIIGLSGSVDWGVHSYAPTGGTPGIDPDNGGIVGTVSYDTTRNELDPRYAAVEDWQPGVSGLTVDLYLPVDCGTNVGAPCDARGDYELAGDGSYAKGQLLNTYVTETWQRPTDCIARDVNGDPLVHGVDEQVLPTTAGAECLEGPLQGIQFGTFPGEGGGREFGSNVDGNYGFGDGCFGPGGFDTNTGACADGNDPTALTGDRDYLVKVEIPNDATGKPEYQFTREEDINIGNGDQIVPQVPPPACAGPLHTVDVAGSGTDGYSELVGNGTNGAPLGVTVPASTPVDNATILDINGSPYEGMAKPLCDTKLVFLHSGKSVVPTFNVFTDVPLPGRFFGLLVDDLNFSADPRSLLYGEKAGVPFAPLGIYDSWNRLVTTVETDANGIYDVLLPSTNRINCPTPSGVCASVWRFVGNDPGIPGRLNTNYNPQYRTIAAEFESWPGLIVPADNAPTQVGVSVQLPGAQANTAVSCPVNPPGVAASSPELFAVDKPYADMRSAGTKSFTIHGQGFGATQGAGEVALDGVALGVTSWGDEQIVVTVPASMPVGPHQLEITANGHTTTNGLTYHVLGYGPFPSTSVLDDFNRTGFGSNWNVTSGTFSLSSPTGGNTSTYNVRVTGTGTMRWGGSAGGGPVYGADQEAYFTFYKVSPTATEQGLFLKVTGNGNNPDPTSNGSAYIEVSYKATSPSSIQVRTKRNGSNTVVLQATFPATFGANDQLGARALADGTVIAYKNGTEVGRVNVVTNPAVSAGSRWLAANAAAGGRLGIRFVGAQNSTTNDARFDDFGGGTVTGYVPNVYEVGPGRTYATIQAGIDAAEASNGNDLVVVYPGAPDGRVNPRGAYYENLIITQPLKLQGVGPGGTYLSSGNTEPGSIIDGSAFGGDTALADAWRTRLESYLDPDTGVPSWLGNPNVYEGQVIYLLAFDAHPYGAAFKASIDGLDIRGGDQQAFPNNINQTGGGPSGLPPEVVIQGGAVFANAYIRNLQITNNVVENNGGAYGTIRIGTADLPAPDTSQHNEDLRIADNRIVANAGTNLGGAIALFAGADRYEIAGNDICGNFSAEYGGGISHYGLSPNGKIHHNRILFNRSYDEGGGILIAGTLAADPTANYGTPNGAQGSGPVDIYANVIQGNVADDDGGGLRFLMAGNVPMNVYDNVIANNVSTHEGGGVSLNDAPNVRFYGNTVMKNITTATAVTSLGFPAPAGLSTSANSVQLQATLPAASPSFSNPLLFNDIFWDNRAGTRGVGTVTGIGAAGDATPINYWDLGVADGPGSLSPTNSVLQVTTGTVASGTNQVGTNPNVVDPIDVSLAFAPWRTNPNFTGAILVVAELPSTVNGDYHLQSTSTAAIDHGAASKAVPSYQQPPSTLSAPAFDIDGQARPNNGAQDIGADEYYAAGP
jgi:hypothetical protein